MKKIISLILALGLIMVCGITPAFAASPVLQLSCPKAVDKGSEFVVSITLSSNPGFNAVQFTLKFSSSKVTCTEIKSGDVINGSLVAGNTNASGGAIIAAASTNEMTGDGVIAYFVCEAKSDLTSSDFSLVNIELAGSSGASLNPTVARVETDAVTLDGSADISDLLKLAQAAVLVAESVSDASNTVDTRKELYESEQTDDSAAAETSKTESTQQSEEESSSEASASESGSSENTTAEDKSEDQTADASSEQTLPVNSDIHYGYFDKVGTSDVEFDDIKGHWAADYIKKSVALGIFNGIGYNKFGPDSKITRGQFVTVLYRMSGSPAVTVSVPFTDISGQSAEFKSAIAWAYSKGLVNGKAKTLFAPEDSLTRQEAMKILFAYSGGTSGAELMFTQIYNDLFKDSSLVASWAKPAVYWGIYNGLVAGSDDRIDPEGTATRAQLAKILVIYCDKFNAEEK